MSMNTEIRLFEREEFGQVRVLMRDGEPWFVAKDICDALSIDNSRDIVAALDEDEKGVDTVDTLGGEQEMSIISEAGLYSCILRSRKPEAKAFKRWVTHEVLPAIRKTGTYGIALPNFSSPAEAARAWADMYEKKALAEQQRDYYRRTKAEIGSRREATAMSTASVYKRKADRLEDRLGEGVNWKAVTAQEKTLRRWFHFQNPTASYIVIGKQLAKLSREMKESCLPVADSRYGTVNAYHLRVWNAFFRKLSQDPNYLRKYRLGDAS